MSISRSHNYLWGYFLHGHKHLCPSPLPSVANMFSFSMNLPPPSSVPHCPLLSFSLQHDMVKVLLFLAMISKLAMVPGVCLVSFLPSVLPSPLITHRFLLYLCLLCCYTSWVSELDSNWVTLAPNGIKNLGLFLSVSEHFGSLLKLF